jgi:polar amino acid transport system substrate-binding protein
MRGKGEEETFGPSGFDGIQRRLMRLFFCLLGLLLLPVSGGAQTVKIGSVEDRPPYIIGDAMSGLELELVRAAFDEMDIEAEFSFVSRKRQALFFNNGDIDAVMTVNENSQLQGFWSEQYIQYDNVAITLAKNKFKINKLADLSNHSVVGFPYADVLLGEDYKEVIDASRYQEVDPQINQSKMLYIGRVDVIVLDRYIFRHLSSVLGSTVDTTPPVVIHNILPPTGYKIVFRREGIRDAFNLGLAKIRDGGKYASLVDKYLGEGAYGSSRPGK